MTVTLSSLLTTLQRRLSDESGLIWSGGELEGYIQEGYDDLTKRTGCLFDTAMLPDFAFCFSYTEGWELAYILPASSFAFTAPANNDLFDFTYTQAWESSYLPSGAVASGPFQFTSPGDSSLALSTDVGPGTHSYTWEFLQGYTLDGTPTTAGHGIPEPPGDTANGPARFTSSFERDYINNARGPANHNQPWEFNSGYVGITEIDALADLPENLQEVERATWNTRRIAAARSRDLETWDSRYELNKGPVDGYVQDKDGIGVLRKWRVPSAPYVPYTFDDGTAFTFTEGWEEDYLPAGAENAGPLQFTGADDQPFAGATDLGGATHNYRWEVFFGYAPDDQVSDGFGIIRDLDGIFDINVQSDGFGDLVQVDTVNVFEDFGILGPIYKETNAVRLEYRRRGAVLDVHQPFEIADRYTVYVRHYAQARALEREGHGQDLALAKNFDERYAAGIARMIRRKEAMAFQRGMVMGGGPSIRQDGPPLPKLPWHFGRVVRR